MQPASSAVAAPRLGRRAALAGLGASLLAPGLARAQAGAGIVTLMHGFAPGGPADAIARLVAPSLGQALGRSVIVDAKPGAGGQIAAAAVARGPADGSLIGLVTGGHAVTAAFGRQQVDAVEAFAMVGLVVRYAFVLAVRADAPHGDLKALLAAAKASPAAIQFGSAGNGTTQHLAGELLNATAGTEITHVPYRGDAASMMAVLSGELPLAITAANVALPFLEAGKVRLLAITAARRAPLLPQVPTVAEAALPGYECETWAGLLAPRATPEPAIAALNAALGEALQKAEVREKLTAMLVGEVAGGGPAEMRGLVTSEIARWRALIRERQINPE